MDLIIKKIRFFINNFLILIKYIPFMPFLFTYDTFYLRLKTNNFLKKKKEYIISVKNKFKSYNVNEYLKYKKYDKIFYFPANGYNIKLNEKIDRFTYSAIQFGLVQFLNKNFYDRIQKYLDNNLFITECASVGLMLSLLIKKEKKEYAHKIIKQFMDNEIGNNMDTFKLLYKFKQFYKNNFNITDFATDKLIIRVCGWNLKKKCLVTNYYTDFTNFNDLLDIMEYTMNHYGITNKKIKIKDDFFITDINNLTIKTDEIYKYCSPKRDNLLLKVIMDENIKIKHNKSIIGSIYYHRNYMDGTYFEKQFLKSQQNFCYFDNIFK